MDSGYPDINPSRASNANNATLQDSRVSNSNNATLQDTVNGAVGSAKATAAQAADAIANTQAYQTVANGPVANTANKEINATKNEFSNLAAARQTPNVQTATGQNLTHYHSMFYSLLSWENPRATAISYAVLATSIIVARYVPLDRYILKALFTVLGIAAAAELLGHVVLGEGFATKIRPRKYYTIPRETLESVLGDVEQLINFFVIEFQRVLFAENIVATLTAFFAAVLSYFLVKVTPYWGLAFIGVTAIYFVPLIYISNRQLIDEQINNASHILTAQATQVRDLAAQQTNKAFEVTSSATQQYVSKAQGYMGSTKKAAVDNGLVSKQNANTMPGVPVEKAKPFDASANGSYGTSSNNPFNASANSSFSTPANNSFNHSANSSVNSSAFPTAPKSEPYPSQPHTAVPQSETLPSQPITNTQATVPAQ